MPRDLASVRLDAHTTFRYVLFIEGIPYAWTDDESGSLTGSGLGSWIGTSESQIGGVEVLGTRTVRPGLIVPESVRFEIEDLKTGALLPAPARFDIIDPMLGSLFAARKSSTVMQERVAAGTSALGTSVQVEGGGTLNPRGRHIGIERIGESGERRTCPAIPYSLVGYEHAYGEGLPPLLISDEPIDFAGRMVTLYRIHADPTEPGLGGELDATSFYRWDEAHDAGDLVWWGVMQDAGYVSGDEQWSIECHGPDALLRRRLGAINDSRWIRINAEPALDTDHNLVALAFSGRGRGVSDSTHDASVFDHEFTGTDRASMAIELNGWISDAVAGTDTNWVSGNGSFDGLTDGPTGSLMPTAGVTTEGVFWVRRVADDPGDDSRYAQMNVTMHERRWRMLGYQPETQTAIEDVGDVVRVEFRRETAGGSLLLTGVEVPADGYWTGIFTTIALGYTRDDLAAYDNDGAPRNYYPYHTAEVFVVDRHGGQVITLQEPPSYLEGQLTAGRFAASEISGAQTSRAGWFAMRGEVALSEDDPSTSAFEIGEPVQRHQVAQMSWTDGPTYGSVGVGDGFEAALYLERFLDGRAFGFADPPMTYDWSGKVAGEGGIEVARLNAYHYFLDDAPAEISETLLLQVLLSTGACEGWDDAVDAGGSITAGPNTHPSAPAFAGDYEIADLGLGVPYQLVASPSAWRAAFDSVPGGWAGPLNRMRPAYVGSFQSTDLLSSILRPRGLAWSLHGKQFGAFTVGPLSPEDSALSIDEEDLVGQPLDPVTAAPQQTLRATGQIDAVVLQHNLDPAERKYSATYRADAQDPGARRRTGELVEEIEAGGLRPPPVHGGVMQAGEWHSLFRQLWSDRLARFFAERHYALEFQLAKPLGQDAMPGTPIRITNPWPIAPDGSRGITNASGRVISAEHMLRQPYTRVRAIVFVGGEMRTYAPMVRVRRFSGTTIEYYPDGLQHGGDAVDGTGFDEPEWSTAGGAINADVYQRSPSGDWTLIDTVAVVSVNRTARTMTLGSAVSGVLRDRDHILVVSEYDAQDGWPTSVFGTIADNDNAAPATPYVS